MKIRKTNDNWMDGIIEALLKGGIPVREINSIVESIPEEFDFNAIKSPFMHNVMQGLLETCKEGAMYSVVVKSRDLFTVPFDKLDRTKAYSLAVSCPEWINADRDHAALAARWAARWAADFSESTQWADVWTVYTIYMAAKPMSYVRIKDMLIEAINENWAMS